MSFQLIGELDDQGDFTTVDRSTLGYWNEMRLHKVSAGVWTPTYNTQSPTVFPNGNHHLNKQPPVQFWNLAEHHLKIIIRILAKFLNSHYKKKLTYWLDLMSPP